MPDNDQQQPSQSILRLSHIFLVATVAVLALVVIIGIGATVLAAGEAAETGRWQQLASPIWVILASLVVAAWVLVGAGLIRVVVSNRQGIDGLALRITDLENILQQHRESLKELLNMESLTDKAKQFIHHERELEMLSEVVHDEILRGDYDAANKKIDSIESLFGYGEMAGRLREEVSDARRASQEEKIDQALTRFQAILDEHDWPRAIRAVRHMTEAFPGHAKVAVLGERVEAARTKHKRQLLQEYGEAVQRNDIEHSIALIRELDRHLTPQEAAALQESARGVFRTKLHNLGVQFAIHVTDQRWDAAIATGEEIMRSFPNSRMSHEVRQKMPQLRAHAAETSA